MRVRFEEIATGHTGSAEAFIVSAPREARALGDLAVLVDASVLPEALRYLGAVIAGAAKRAYYDAASSSIQRSFTAALRAANDALAQEAQVGSAQWVGSLHAIVLASDHDSLLIAQTGGCAAWLARHGRVQEIPLEAGEGTRPFGSYSSGKLQSGDRLLFGSREALRGQPVDPDLATQPERFLRTLERASISSLALAADPDLSPSRATAGTMESLREAVSLGLSLSGSLFVQLLRVTNATWTGLLHFAQTKLHQLRDKQSRRGDRQPLRPTTNDAAAEAPAAEVELKLPDSDPQPQPQTADATPVTERPPVPLAALRQVPAGTWLRSRLHKVVTLRLGSGLAALPGLGSLSRQGGRRARLATAGILLLLGASAVATPYLLSRGTDQAAAAAAEAIAAAQLALERGETELILGNEDQAIAAFSEGIAHLEGVTEAEVLRHELIRQRNALAGIREVDVRQALSFSGFPVELSASRIAVLTPQEGETTVALAGPRHPAVWINDALEPTDGTFAVLPYQFRSGVADLAVIADERAVLVATHDGLVAFDAATRAVIAATLAPSGAAFDFVATDGDAIFALDTAGQDLYTVTLARETAAAEDGTEAVITTLKAEIWIRDQDARLAGTRDFFVTDGTPHALISETTFLGFARGRRPILYTIEGFSWTGTVSAIVPLHAGDLLALDSVNARLLRTKANGDIIEQYEVPQATAAVSLSADSATALILTADGIVEVTLPPQQGSEEAR